MAHGEARPTYNRRMIRALLAGLLLSMPLSVTTAANVAPMPAGDATAGAASFHMCASCHQVGPGARSGFGPQLNGVIGRRAAGTADYAYSAAMKKSGIVWDERTLTAFLRDPDKVVPGTKMRFWGIGNEQKIANLLAYLRQYR